MTNEYLEVYIILHQVLKSIHRCFTKKNYTREKFTPVSKFKPSFQS
jgi:hypothetical protein